MVYSLLLKFQVPKREYEILILFAERVIETEVVNWLEDAKRLASRKPHYVWS